MMKTMMTEELGWCSRLWHSDTMKDDSIIYIMKDGDVIFIAKRLLFSKWGLSMVLFSNLVQQ